MIIRTSTILSALLLCSLLIEGRRGDAALVAHYPLDIIDAGTTPDSTGGTAGTISGSGLFVAASGAVGSSFDFTTTGNSVGIPNHPWGTTAFTASVWFSPDSLGNQGPLADWTNGGVSPQTFLIRSSGSNLQTYGHNGSVQRGGNVSFASETLTAGDFNHVVLTYDGQRARTYLNGELSTTVHDFGTPSTIGNGSEADIAAIGGRGSSEYQMVGLVDDVAFWDETLTDGKAAAISSLVNQPELNYHAGQADQLFQVFDGTLPNVEIGGRTWAQDTGLGGAAGDVVDLGGGAFFLNLDGTAGVSSSSGGGGGPEPTPVIVAQFDVNAGSSPTQDGFLGLSSTGTGTQNGVTLTSSAGFDEYRDRGWGATAHDSANLLRDFGFENDGTKTVTFDLTGLSPNTEHEITIFSYDRSANGGSISEWYEDAVGGAPLVTHTIVSSDPDSADFTLNMLSDDNGSIRIAATSNALVIFNGMSVAEMQSAGVPEPSTFVLAALGLLGLGWYGRRRWR